MPFAAEAYSCATQLMLALSAGAEGRKTDAGLHGHQPAARRPPCYPFAMSHAPWHPPYSSPCLLRTSRDAIIAGLAGP